MSDTTISLCTAEVLRTMGGDERIMRVRMGQPLSSRADYLTRYKVDIATLDPSGMQASNWRCVVVNVSSNTGAPTIDRAVSCDNVPDLAPFPS